ncbi:putative 4-diphosphocytidyl-2-C-methyl-D-erythritol kinase [Austwickia sp. TVS 96-490-7B]|uniref:GHMP family kinase ATP-binding protein n=1 Tax=Austwickia sp. TVS 96-490-7B TaxID=2830843 RepID=UPI001C5896E3|nr:hypothetical protein [Austwickia sp. TVS 96-490-7B]MBW3086606.1 putative 4-diphosphocytidyl-2-C-methyl-D-erythritol kinase [Austwickia sp. TVS 96-490-7B]
MTTVSRRRCPSRTRIGWGIAHAHHGEILQGIFTGPDGEPCQGLVTVPLRCAGSEAFFYPEADTDGPIRVRVEPSDRVYAAQAATALITRLHHIHGLPRYHGRLVIQGRLPIGAGMGSSSSDVLAALRAVGNAMRACPCPDELSRLAVSIEGACDPLAHLPRTVLFAQRLGEVLEDFGALLPPMTVLSCRTGGGAPVETLACPPPTPALIPEYDRLRHTLRQAVVDGDIHTIGAVATASAELNQERLPRPELTQLRAIAAGHGAVGVQVAHSGSVAGLLFPGSLSIEDPQITDSAASLEHHGIPVLGIHPLLDGG